LPLSGCIGEVVDGLLLLGCVGEDDDGLLLLGCAGVADDGLLLFGVICDPGVVGVRERCCPPEELELFELFGLVELGDEYCPLLEGADELGACPGVDGAAGVADDEDAPPVPPPPPLPPEPPPDCAFAAAALAMAKATAITI
jgi:hypothetical protein